MTVLNKTLNALEKICLILSTASIGVMISLNIIQVFFRYVLNASFTWIFPMTMLLFMWCTFLGLFVVYRRKKDIVVSFATNLFPATVREKLTILTNTLIILFLLLIIAQAPTLIQKQTSIMQVILLPRYVQALPLFIGLTGILLEYVSQTVTLIKGMQKSSNMGRASRS